MSKEKLKQGGFISAFLKFMYIADCLNDEMIMISANINRFKRSNKDSSDPSFLKFIEYNDSIVAKSDEFTFTLPISNYLNKINKPNYRKKKRIDNALINIGAIWGNTRNAPSIINIIDDVLCKRANFARSACEPFGNFSNTCILRNFNIEDRRISIINKRLSPDDYVLATTMAKRFTSLIDFIYYILFLRHNNEFQKSIVGFISGKSYIDHARIHLGCRSAISIDISKFYDNTTLHNIVSKGLFYKVLCAGFENITGVEFSSETVDHYDLFHRMFGVMNLQFITLMNYYTHNGRLPTGMPYSPTVSNLLFAPIDTQIIKNLDKSKTYSRYADDICISTKEEKDNDGNFTIGIEDAKFVETVVRNNGYRLKYSKTKIMGPRDKKVIAGIVLGDSSDGQKLSIGTARKLSMAEEYKNKHWVNDLTNHDRGILEWVRNINFSQYQFITRDIVDVPENKKVPVVMKDRNIDSLYFRYNTDDIVKNYRKLLSK